MKSLTGMPKVPRGSRHPSGTEEQLRVIVDSVRVGVLVHDLETRIVTSNAWAQELLGHAGLELRGRRACDPDWPFLRADGSPVPETEYPVMRVLASGQPLRDCLAGVQVRGAGGAPAATKWVLVNADPIFDEAGALSQVIVAFMDITKRERARLREQERRLILESIARGEPLASTLEGIVRSVEADDPGSLCSILLLDEEGQCLLMGAAPNLPDCYHQTVHGLAIGEGVGCCGTAAFRKRRVVAEDILDHPEWATFHELARKADLRSCWSEPILTPDDRVLGTFTIYHHHPAQPDAEGIQRVEEACTFAHLAIEHWRADEAIKAAKTFIDGVVNTIADPVFVKDEERRLLLVNDALCAIAGHPRDELLGKLDEEMFTKEQAAAFRAVDESVLASGQEHVNEEALLHPSSGAPRTILTRKTRYVGPDGRRFIVGVIRDITELKGKEQQLRALNAELEARVEARTLELREARQFHEQIVESAAEGIVVYDARLRCRIWNPFMERLSGLSACEVLGRRPMDLLPFLNDTGLRAGLERALAGFVADPIELECRGHGNGTTAWVSSVSGPLRDGSGSIIGVISTIRDLTESKWLSDQLNESETLYRTLFMNSRDALMTLSQDSGRFTSCNPATLLMFDVQDQAQFLSLGPWDLSPEIQPDGRPSAEVAKERIGTALREGSHAFEWMHRRLKGATFPATVLLTRIELGDQVLLLATVRDISAQKLAEASLREATEQFQLIVQTIDDVFWVVDADKPGIAYISDAVERVWRRSRQAMMEDPRAFLEALHPDDRHRMAKHAQSGEAGQPFDREYRIVWPDGTVRWIWDRGYPLVDGAGRVIRFVGVAKDITERKRLEAELRASTEEILIKNTSLKRANRARSEFMANVTHELRTPLNSVIGFAAMLKDGVPGPLNPKQADFATDILEGGYRLLALVNAILEFTRFDESGFWVSLECLDIGPAIEECVAPHHAMAGARGITIEVSLEPGLGTAEFDPPSLHRLLKELLNNAIKFNRDGGRVTVKARRVDDWVEISVADTGIGIAPGDIPKLFKPLVQLDTGVGRRFGGVGMGLAVAQRLAERQGGTITLESEIGQGSLFTLRLPLER